jgi:hypothetical protein
MPEAEEAGTLTLTPEVHPAESYHSEKYWGVYFCDRNWGV